MRLLRRTAERLVLWAMLAGAVAAVIAVGSRGMRPAAPPDADANAEAMTPPHGDLLRGEYRGLTAEQAVDVLDRRYAGRPE